MKLILRFIALLLVLCMAQAVVAGEVVDRIVAQANGDIITLYELNAQIKPLLARFQGKKLTDEDKAAIAKLRSDLLSRMVDDLLLEQEVARLGLDATDSEVLNAVEDFRKRSNLDEEEFQTQLLLEGMTLDQFKEKIRKDILKHRLLGFMVKRKVVVSDEEIKEYFEANKQQYTTDRQVDLSVILLPEGQSAEQLRQRIEKDEISFEDAANLYSQGPGAGQGGSIGKLTWKDLAPDWQQALDGVAAGGMSPPFVFRGLETILKINAMDTGEQESFENVRQEIYNKLYQQQLDSQFKDYMDQLRSKAVIEIKL